MTAQKRTTAKNSCRPFLLFDQILAVEFLFRKLLCGVLMYELEYYRREGNEKHNTDKAEELAAKQCRKERPQRRKPHAAANHMRVDELIFRELHRLIDDQAQQRLLRLGKQRQQYADCAGGQRADVGNKGEGRRG